MPIYEYECLDCGRKFEYLVRSADDAVICPHCNRKKLRRLISTFSFKSKGADGTVASSAPNCSSCASRNCSSCGM